ncbi:MAG: RluA family pseudouridine synthase [Parcubacteria group bacterium]
MEILYEDNHLIAVFKPAGVLTQADDPGAKCLMDDVKKYLKDKYQKPGNVFLGLLHRLDRNVSGIVLFAKTSKGASRLSAQFRERTIQKQYHAIVEGVLKEQKKTLVHFLKKDSAKNKVEIFNNGNDPDSTRVMLDYEVVKSNDNFSLLKIDLHTGKSHQIRAQLSFIGHPIVGDAKYGSKIKLKNNEIGLCATSLSFQTATTGENKKITIEYPAEWNKFTK